MMFYNVQHMPCKSLCITGECGALAVYETDLYVLKRVKGSAREMMELICLNLS